MSPEEERRDAQIEALISIVGSMLAVFDVKSDAADLWPETMRAGTVDEILYHGATRRIDLLTDIGRLTAAMPTGNAAPMHEGQAVRAVFAREALHLMDG